MWCDDNSMHSILDLLIKCMYAKDLSQKQENTQLHHLRWQHSLSHTYTRRTIVTNLEGCGKKNTNALSVLHTHGTYPPHPLQHQPSPLSCLQKTVYAKLWAACAVSKTSLHYHNDTADDTADGYHSRRVSQSALKEVHVLHIFYRGICLLHVLCFTSVHLCRLL